ncbi:aldehyde dehydrogenase family protein [Burkholderia ambifaria]|uniref:aldehyde dehydrogenase family protein n=1 Tax=Burkholderia ambifaria TaxID=152480 RepID=UPI001BA17B38|nr:aldehyde dehydrogenase family protein [Burkholderia ambifaria]MBR8175788.1 aldehyde dehydrogenase family protein [Burkholderia ambifaria]
MTEFTHAQFTTDLNAIRQGKPNVVPHVVDGRRIFEGEVIYREDPAFPSAIVSGSHEASDALVLEAVAASRKAQLEWDTVPLAERVRLVRKGIAFGESKLRDWTARLGVETGKTFGAARAEVLETLAFLKFYPDYADAPGAFEDERVLGAPDVCNQSVLRPYGVFGVITPFNYPMALSAGPAIAAVLAGNGAVIKSSHLGPWCGQAVYEMFEAMDLPTGLVNIVHGADAPGKALVNSSVDGMSFVGSVQTGLSIMRQFNAGPYPKPVIAEMGGKNPVIVTDSADLEAAADGIVFSSFDLIGQKCSALSRVLVTPGVHDRLVELVEARLEGLKIADPAEADAFAGPLITKETVERFQRVVASAREAGLRVAGGERVEAEGYFVKPVVISSLSADHELSTREHFLPLVTISKVASFDEALKAANQLSVGLTAGIYTGDESEAQTFLRRIEAGCVDVNIPGHACTGWFPGPQTFGGWKASGSTGKQAYGKWYVQQFAREQARKVPLHMRSLLD